MLGLTHRGRRLAGLVALAATVAGCSSSASPAASLELQAQVASYDLSVSGPPRLLIGITGSAGRVVSFGTIQVATVYLGTKDKPVAERELETGPAVDATWIPIPKQKLPDPLPTTAQVQEGSEGVGVYETTELRFDRAGIWGIAAIVPLDGKQVKLQRTVMVGERPAVPAPGEQAPRTVQPLAGSQPAKAVDSRAATDGAVPDPALHSITVADAVASGRPTVVVVSTPVYCLSRFCGPITDAAEELAARTPGVNVVHLEVWADYEGKKLNEAAKEWIYRPGALDANEPWVFVIDAAGRIVQRFDNVVSDAQLAAAVRSVL